MNSATNPALIRLDDKTRRAGPMEKQTVKALDQLQQKDPDLNNTQQRRRSGRLDVWREHGPC